MLRPNDFRAMDLIGYEISVIPEGGSFGFVLVSVILALGGSKLVAAWQVRHSSTSRGPREFLIAIGAAKSAEIGVRDASH